MDWRSGVVAALVIPFVAQFGELGRAGAAQNASPAKPVAELQFSKLRPDATLPLELEPGALALPDGVWVPQRAAAALVRVDPKNNTPDAPIGLPQPPCASVVSVADALWVPLCGAGALARVDRHHGNVSPPFPLPVAEPGGTIAAAVRSVWAITDAKGVVSRIDPATGKPVAEIYVATRPFAVAAEDDQVWVTSEEGDTLTRIDANTNLVIETMKVGPRPGPLVIGEGAVWTLNRGDGSVSRVDLKSNKVAATIPVGEPLGRGMLAAGDGAIWLTAPGTPIVRIDTRTNRVTHRFAGPGGGAILVAHGSLWVTAGPKTTWRIDPKLIAAMRP